MNEDSMEEIKGLLGLSPREHLDRQEESGMSSATNSAEPTCLPTSLLSAVYLPLDMTQSETATQVRAYVIHRYSIGAKTRWVSSDTVFVADLQSYISNHQDELLHIKEVR